jgi:hypothetical protein
MSIPMYLAFLALVATTGGLASEAPDENYASCSTQEGGTLCASGELGLSDDTQVLLQGQRMAITEHSKISSLPPQHMKFQVNPSDYVNSMTLVTAVEINGVRQSTGDLLVFVGDALQGVQKASNTPHFGPQNGKALYDVMIYGHGPDAGKDVSFVFLTPQGKIVLLDPIGMATAPTFTADTRLSNDAGTVNHMNPLMLKPPPPKCQDGSQADMDAYIAKHFPLFAYPGLTCAMFHGWGQCILVHPVCGQTCPDSANAGHCQNAFAQTQESDEAHLAPAPPADTGYQVVPSDYENSMTTVAIVEIDGVLQSQGDVLVFVDEKLQGIQGSSNIPPMPQKIRGVPGHTNTPCWDLMIYGHGNAPGGPPSDAGKKVTVEFLTPHGKLVPLKTPTETEVFSANAHLANHLEPLLLTNAVTQ